ncbi:hypothetical protein GCM10009850_043910 [Nonomuraea monospora]|uniref:Uncharacterized protein n=1 Tax=Nonomuraea monospora TaxID=568818 RepID=A0ABN3CHR1_9ACTN
MSSCKECGAGRNACESLFHELLVRDYSGRPPWAPLHAVSVACYLFQHPTRTDTETTAFYWALLHAYLQQGIDALTFMTQRARQRNSHRFGGRAPTADDFPGAPPFPPVSSTPTTYAVTIQDVAADGSFPAEGYEDRVRRWADATISAWKQASAH